MQHITHNKDISYLSNYRTPASSRYFFSVQNRQDIDKIYKTIVWILKERLPYIVVTGGTNTLFAFDIFPGLVIHIDLHWWFYDNQTKILSCSAGDKIWDIAEKLESDYGQNIWHRFIGLPWSIAGAIYGNAGCFWLETAGNFKEVEVLDQKTWKILCFTKDVMDFSYRSSRIKEEKRYIILWAIFDLSSVVEKYHSDVDNVYFREHKQPKWNSCGSFFKNPSIDRDEFLLKNRELTDACPLQISAWFLIEQVWLKWMKKGWAYFSDLHANFLIHDGCGTYHDLLDLIKEAQDRVFQRFSIRLESEVQIIFPQEILF
jgi:UDP-N-acetylmuramate dehydrogenase